MEGTKPKPLPRADRGGPEKIAVEPDWLAAEKLPAPGDAGAAVPSLYDRLGKEAGIVKVVDDFVTFVVADDDIRDIHKKHFKEGDVAGLKKKLVDQIGEATGGPQKYTGKNMKDAHKGMEITNKDFDALARDIAKALDKNGVAEADKQAILKMLGSMRKDVVEKAD
jgi:hemoglobin